MTVPSHNLIGFIKITFTMININFAGESAERRNHNDNITRVIHVEFCFVCYYCLTFELK